MRPLVIVSGGQTGADRAALDWAISHGVEHRGWCPAGRRADDGPLDAKYRFAETEGKGYRAWLRRNRVARLNVAGPREGKRPGMYRATHALLERLLSS